MDDRIRELEREITIAQTEIKNIKEDFRDMKDDVKEIKQDIGEMKKGFNRLPWAVLGTVAVGVLNIVLLIIKERL